MTLALDIHLCRRDGKRTCCLCGRGEHWLDRIPAVRVFPFDHMHRERLGFLSKLLHRLFRMHRFGRIDADQPHSFAGFKHDRIAIDDTLDLTNC